MGSRHTGIDGVYGARTTASRRRHRANTGDVLPDPISGFAPEVTGRRSPSMIGAAPSTSSSGKPRGTTFINPETERSASRRAAPSSRSRSARSSRSSRWRTEPHLGRRASKLERVVLALTTNVPADVAGAIQTPYDYGLFADAFGDGGHHRRAHGFALATYQRTLPDQTPGTLHRGDAARSRHRSARAQRLHVQRAALRHLPHASPSPTAATGTRLRDIAGTTDVARCGGFSDRGKFKVPSLRNAGLARATSTTATPLQLAVPLDLLQPGRRFLPRQQGPAHERRVHGASTASDITAFIQNGLTDPRVAQGYRPSTAHPGERAAPGVRGRGSCGHR